MPNLSILRLLFVITDSGIGGSERVLTTLLSSLDLKNIEICGVIVLKSVRDLGRQWEKMGIPVTALNMGRLPSLSVKNKLAKLIHEKKPNVVHSFLFHSAQYCRLTQPRFPSVKFISSPRVNYRFLPSWARAIDRFLSSRDTLALAESQSTMRYLVSDMGYSAQKVKLVRNGVDIDAYQYDEEARLSWRKAWGMCDTDIVIGTIGRLHPQKGLDVFLDSIRHLSETVSSVRWVIVGDGPLKKQLMDQASSYGIDVLFTGNLMPANGVYSAFDIYVQSSRYEGLSNALLEAMSAGLPIVATAVDGTLDVARDGENMLLVPPENDVALATSLKKLIVGSQMRTDLAQAARKTAEYHSLQKMVEKYQEIYKEITFYDSTR